MTFHQLLCLSMEWIKDLEVAMRRDFDSLRAKNPRFSLRAYANRIGFSQAAVSQLFNGKLSWNLTVDKAAEIVEKLGISQKEKYRLLALIGIKVRHPRTKVNEEDFLTDWRYLAVLAGLSFSAPKNALENLKSRFQIDETAFEEIVSTLKAKGFIKSEAGENDDAHFAAGDGPSSEVIRKHHANNLALALKTLDQVPSDERHFSSTTFVGSLSQLELIREEVRIFHDRVMSLMNLHTENDEVFQMNINIFPLRPVNEGSN